MYTVNLKSMARAQRRAEGDYEPHGRTAPLTPASADAISSSPSRPPRLEPAKVNVFGATLGAAALAMMRMQRGRGR